MIIIVGISLYLVSRVQDWLIHARNKALLIISCTIQNARISASTPTSLIFP